MENFLFLENQNPRNLVLWKMRLREFSFYGKQESGDLWKKKKGGPVLCGAVRKKKKKKKKGVRRCAALCGKKKKKGGPALCCAVQKGTGAVRRCAEKKKRGPALCGAVQRGTGAVRRCAGKKKIQVRILVLWKTRIREFSLSGKRDSKNSRFMENKNLEICGKKKKRRGPALCDAVREKKKKEGIRCCATLCREGDRRCAALCEVKEKKKGGGVPALCGAVRSKKKKKKKGGVRRCAVLCGKKK